jgi:squalene-hopene/tetraprenyl-beta-curcumene cyclase
MQSTTAETRSEANAALERACAHLLGLQHEGGWWQGELQTNVTMDAEDLLLREFLGIRQAEQTERSAAWIRSQQRPDGTWANFYGGPGELSTTIEAYWALRLAGDPPGAEHMLAAAEFIRAEGGLARARVFTHVWLALFGLWSWELVPALPPEIVLLRPWVPLNIYDFACWARQTIVALSVVKARRPIGSLTFDLAELDVPASDGGADPRRSAPSVPRALSLWIRDRWIRSRPLPQVGSERAGGGGSGPRSAWLGVLDRLLRAYERRPIPAVRKLALRRAELWIVRRQEADGSWGGIQPPWVYSLIALRVCGYPLDHPVMTRALEGLERFMVEDRDDSHRVGAPAGASRRLEACQSPVWDTALAMIALTDAGIRAEHPAMLRAANWLLIEEVTRRGDWSVARPQLPPGGWAFEFANENYPDVDDTAEVVLAMRRVDRQARAARGAPPLNRRFTRRIGAAADIGERIDGAIGRAVRWVQGMQSSDGGWGAFDAENTRTLVRELPFLDFGEVIDEPSADVTAHTLEMLASLGLGSTPAARRGTEWLIDQQEADGSWFGRWGVNHLYGTGAAVPALLAAGVDPSHECIRRAVRWLQEHQNDDGGWGEDPRSYDDPRWIGRGRSTASQTAWALLALHAAERSTPPPGADGLAERRASEPAGGSPALERGVSWLVASQRVDGTWDEPQYTGTGFPSDYYINYHLYRLSFPIMALGRCLAPSPDRDPLGARIGALAGNPIAANPDGAQAGAEAGAGSGRRGRGSATTGADSGAGRPDGAGGRREGAIDLCSVEAQTRCS